MLWFTELGTFGRGSGSNALWPGAYHKGRAQNSFGHSRSGDGVRDFAEAQFSLTLCQHSVKEYLVWQGQQQTQQQQQNGSRVPSKTLPTHHLRGFEVCACVCVCVCMCVCWQKIGEHDCIGHKLQI
jgi:hypothetical protein